MSDSPTNKWLYSAVALSLLCLVPWIIDDTAHLTGEWHTTAIHMNWVLLIATIAMFSFAIHRLFKDTSEQVYLIQSRSQSEGEQRVGNPFKRLNHTAQIRSAQKDQRHAAKKNKKPAVFHLPNDVELRIYFDERTSVKDRTYRIVDNERLDWKVVLNKHDVCHAYQNGRLLWRRRVACKPPYLEPIN